MIGSRLRQLRADVELKIGSGYSYVIDVINACPLRCPSCPIGHEHKPNGAVMSLELFRAILDKAEREGRIKKIDLNNWSDSLIHRDLHLFVREAIARGHPTQISTTLNRWTCDLPAVMLEGLSVFRISTSGIKEYAKTHRGGNADRVLGNMNALSKMPRHPNTEVIVTFHRYKHNLDEEAVMESIARNFGFGFTAYDASFCGIDKIMAESYTEEDRETLAMLRQSPAEVLAGVKRMDYCFHQTKQIVIDAEAKVSLCCGTYNQIGPSFLDTPLAEVQRWKRTHPLCGDCIRMKLNRYY